MVEAVMLIGLKQDWSLRAVLATSESDSVTDTVGAATSRRSLVDAERWPTLPLISNLNIPGCVYSIKSNGFVEGIQLRSWGQRSSVTEETLSSSE